MPQTNLGRQAERPQALIKVAAGPDQGGRQSVLHHLHCSFTGDRRQPPGFWGTPCCRPDTRLAFGPDGYRTGWKKKKKKSSRAPIYRKRWEHRTPYNNTNNTHSFWSSGCRLRDISPAICVFRLPGVGRQTLGHQTSGRHFGLLGGPISGYQTAGHKFYLLGPQTLGHWTS